MSTKRPVVMLTPGVHLTGDIDGSGAINDPEQIQTGHWYSPCCHLDLYEIDDAETLRFVRECIRNWYDEDAWEPMKYDVWPSKRDALLEIRDRWPQDSIQFTECNKMLAETLDWEDQWA